MQRKRAEDPFERFVEYCAERLQQDPHLWAQTLFDEVTDLGYAGSYPTFTRQLRDRGAAAGVRAVLAGEGPPGGGDRASAG